MKLSVTQTCKRAAGVGAAVVLAVSLSGITGSREKEAQTASHSAAQRGLEAVVKESAPEGTAKAFSHYLRLADEYAEIDPRSPKARKVAHAFVALGWYYRKGVPEIGLKPNPRRAAGLFRHAGSYFGDADAQFNLARMYLDGEGVPKNERLAVKWLTNAAKKRHGPSQALLGDLLWRGSDEIRRQPAKGLALLSLAHENARDEAQMLWIAELHRRAVAEAQADEQAVAADFLQRWRENLEDKAAVAVVSEIRKPVSREKKSGTGGVAANVPVVISPAGDASRPTAGFTNAGMKTTQSPQ